MIKQSSLRIKVRYYHFWKLGLIFYYDIVRVVFYRIRHMLSVGMLCIVPPHLLREIANRGDDILKQWAQMTLSLSDVVRTKRQTFALVTLGIARQDKKERFVYDAEDDTSLPGNIVRKEGDKRSGVLVNRFKGLRIAGAASLKQM